MFDSTSHNVETDICDKLRTWNIQFNVNHNCLNSLLEVLRSEGLKVPKDGRTLMKTPSKHNILQLSNNGSYIHFGIDRMVYPILQKHESDLINVKSLNLGINVDGLPLAKSSKSQFRPILICIINVKVLSKYVIPIAHIVCDAPAKAFLLNVKPHNAYHGCNACIDEGVFNKTMTFLTTNSPMRTDDSFRKKIDDCYHKGISPLEKLPINMVDDIPVDNMHCVYVGVTKRLIKFWVKGKKDIRLLDQSKKDVNE
ncbi:uncharacterized protein LOC112683173, partial [Sipha flava]|uniref:Uncharacterized protein LOC112683173 n=1 Tax=Sipha flava TaxID=143950 RepID=A0A8B8FHM8_9HEMI